MPSNRAVASGTVQCLARRNGLQASLPKKDQYKCRRSYSRASLVTRHRQNLKADITECTARVDDDRAFGMLGLHQEDAGRIKRRWYRTRSFSRSYFSSCFD